ncbi:hypothetical protein P3X46_024020 [Hevea brasiliensis]|uniref:Fe2OG dioxygenase domain-containing protein n=1 Tax=Hevea brasiliensis TaxID=3981 RepID=A0ABQ9LFI9_HEVBR|nr:scopoletin 8-hydroxylase [Hevea brasiliensis]KAJ9164444.1 hypothetical protein P3X46_024020 [Hevea brasiliensis]
MAPSFSDADSMFNFVVRDGNGVKGLADLGLSKVPQKYVQPREERIDKLNATLNNNSPIDLSKLDGPDHDQVVEEIATAAETLGFFQVVNHGVPVELLEALKIAAHSFFGQPAEEKSAYRKGVSPSPLVQYGTSFAPEKEKALEWKDYLSMRYTNDSEAREVWPEECREVALEFLRISIKMVRKLVEILMGKLGVTLDDAKIDALIGLKMVNMNFYPICPNPELTVGVGRHSDLGTLTVLLQDGIGGLYVKVEENMEGKKQEAEWMEIPPIPGALVINIGDTLQIVSNGRYKSAEHRVRTTSVQSRVSIPVFAIPKGTEKIGPLPQVVESDGVALYREVVFEDYMNNFFGNAHGGKKSLDFARIY